MHAIVVFIYFLGLFWTNNAIHANPFAINFPVKEELSNDDYIEIQKQLREIDIRDLIRQLYIPDQGYTTYEDFLSRCSRGISQVLIDPEKGYFPSKHLEKIGSGSDMCIVSCAPFDGVRSKLIQSIPEALRNSGFNGYFYYRIGGFPNPTGREIQFVGVPYSFKIFMMLEAQKLGFNKVLWIDSACLPLCDPSPLLQWLDHVEVFFIPGRPDYRFVFPATQQLLKELTGKDVMKLTHPCTTVLGLKMNAARAKKLIQDYYKMAELGTPFLSCFPEEVVLSTLIAKHYPSLSINIPFRMLKGGDRNLDLLRSEGYFFYHCPH